jgi:hypothetical protein
MIIERGLTPEAVTAGLHRHPRISERFGFLHLPKTGGTGLKDFLLANLDAIASVPIPFGHAWTLRMVRSQCPGLRLSLLLRDPLERVISGFQSRLREGRPRYAIPWRREEAEVFGHYPTVDSFLNGLSSDDPQHDRMIGRAMEVIPPLRLGYRHCFESVDHLLACRDSFHWLGPTTSAELLLDAWRDDGALVLRPDGPGLQVPYRPTHRSVRPSTDYLRDLLPAQIAVIKVRLQPEYELYDALQALAG